MIRTRPRDLARRVAASGRSWAAFVRSWSDELARAAALGPFAPAREVSRWQARIEVTARRGVVVTTEGSPRLAFSEVLLEGSFEIFHSGHE